MVWDDISSRLPKDTFAGSGRRRWIFKGDKNSAARFLSEEKASRRSHVVRFHGLLKITSAYEQ
jgi:hypothetical protein